MQYQIVVQCGFVCGGVDWVDIFIKYDVGYVFFLDQCVQMWWLFFGCVGMVDEMCGIGLEMFVFGVEFGVLDCVVCIV